MDERQLNMLKATAKFAGAEVKDYAELSHRVDDLVEKSERYLNVYSLPGAVACMGYASFLAHAFEANDAFMDDKFTHERDHGFWRTLRFFHDTGAVYEGMNMFELLAIGTVHEVVRNDGDVIDAIDDVKYSIADALDYEKLVEKIAGAVIDLMESINRKDGGKETVRKIHSQFVDSYLTFVNAVRHFSFMKDLLSTIVLPISEEEQDTSIALMVSSMIMTASLTKVPLEDVEAFWERIKGKDGAIREAINDFESKTQELFTEIENSYQYGRKNGKKKGKS